ncbi:MAG: polysaccharide biosynthesis/export family protein [Kiritimatiellales bacterium]
MKQTVIRGVLLLFVSCIVSGCFFSGRQPVPPSNNTVGLYRLRPQDPLQISLLGIPEEKMQEVIIDEYGMITMPYADEPIKASGLTTTELERKIQKMYVDGQIYRNITVNVQTLAKSYFIDGEVKRPQEYLLNRHITLMQAIAAASGYTEYANKRSIEITRAGKVIKVDGRKIEKNPQLDIPLEAGDRIRVNRTFY